jgi:molybdopterin-guanine dinucleotide biosynthesis protein A
MIRRGFLQAGGASTRFGTDKALATIAGTTMLWRTGELLAKICDEVCVVAPAGRYANLPWPVIDDRWPGEGPLGGILTALAALQGIEIGSSWALILSCDTPFLTQEFLAFFWKRVEVTAAQVVVPSSANGLEPLCACWRADSFHAIRAAFERGTRKITEAMKRLPMEVLDESTWKRFDSDNRLFWNMNTPEDYEEARRILETKEQ